MQNVLSKIIIQVAGNPAGHCPAWHTSNGAFSYRCAPKDLSLGEPWWTPMGALMGHQLGTISYWCFAPLTPIHLLVAELWQRSLTATPYWCPRYYQAPRSCASFSSIIKSYLFLSCSAPVQPKLRSRRETEWPTKLRHPTFTGHTTAFQPASLQSTARSEYLACFRSWAASRPSSHGTVSSTSRTILHAVVHITRSGRRDVSTISLWNWGCFPRSTPICHSLPGERSLAVFLRRGVKDFSPGLVKWMNCLSTAVGLLFAPICSTYLHHILTEYAGGWCWRCYRGVRPLRCRTTGEGSWDKVRCHMLSWSGRWAWLVESSTGPPMIVTCLWAQPKMSRLPADRHCFDL